MPGKDEKIPCTDCFLKSDTQLVKILKSAFDVEGLKKEVNNLNSKFENMNSSLKRMNSKLFISNGDICLSEKVRYNSYSITQHEQEHVKIQEALMKENKNKKWNIGTFISIISVLIALFSVIIVGVRTYKAEEQLKKEIINIIKRETDNG